MSQNRWADITNKVEAKMEDGVLYLYHNHQPIGHLNLDPSQVTMIDGFRLDNGKIWAENRMDRIQQQYAEDGCDLDWCQ